MKVLLQKLAARAGRYAGESQSRHGGKCRAELEIVAEMKLKRVRIFFRSVGPGHQVDQQQLSYAVFDPKLRGFFLYYLANNPRELRYEPLPAVVGGEKGMRVFQFGIGDTDNMEAFREEFTLSLFPNGDFGYHYYSRVAGGFAEVSADARLPPIAQA